MTPLRWVGLIVAILGIASLFIPIPHNERHGIKVGDVSLGVITQSDDKVPMAVSVVMLLGGLGVMAVGSKRGS